MDNALKAGIEWLEAIELVKPQQFTPGRYTAWSEADNCWHVYTEAAVRALGYRLDSAADKVAATIAWWPVSGAVEMPAGWEPA